jgi:hypothetical protein
VSKKYPRFDSIFKTYKRVHPNGTPPCELCDKPAVVRIFMEVNYMNGDDEDFRVCDEHLKLAKADGEGFYDQFFRYRDGKES